MYIELHAASAFSFMEGASVPEELAAVCAEHGMLGMAMADRDGVYGAPRFHMAMNKAGMRAHIGSEITFAPRRHAQDRVIGRSGDRVIQTPTQITRSCACLRGAKVISLPMCARIPALFIAM